MSEYNAEFFLQRLEKAITDVQLSVTNVQSDVKEIQISMAELKHLGTLLPRVSEVEQKAEHANLELTKLSIQFQTFKDAVDKHKLGVIDILKGSGAFIGWIAAIVSVFALLR